MFYWPNKLSTVSQIHKEKEKERCALRVHIIKAYDSFNWEFILHCLIDVEMPMKVLECFSYHMTS